MVKDVDDYQYKAYCKSNVFLIFKDYRYRRVLKTPKRDFNPDLDILHVGTNHLSLNYASKVISSCIIDTSKSLMT